MTDLLIIEDNEELAQLLCDFLKREDYSVFHALTGEEGLSFLEKNQVQLVLLDIMLPNIDGFGVCKQIRQQKNLPIIIISARVGKEDKIAGLDLGADDYVEKPFDIDVLLAKIKSNLRRSYQLSDENSILVDGNIKIDLDANSVFIGNKQVEMTIKEYELLVLFFQNKGKTLRKEWIFDKVWGIDSFSEPSTLTVHINKLREKIELNPKNPKRIITVWGIGYKYEAV